VRYPKAIWRPGPQNKVGYPDTGRTYAAKQYLIGHSSEGSLESNLGELDNPDNEHSWTLTNDKTAHPLLQHYDILAITWNANNKVANISSVSIEHEGFAGEALTEHQIRKDIELFLWLQAEFGWGPARRATWLREHSEFSPTACPSGRMPWERIIREVNAVASISAEELIAMKQEVALLRINSELAGLCQLGRWQEIADKLKFLGVTAR
jgi:hypothetical protein